MTLSRKDATETTNTSNASLLKLLPFDDRSDFEGADRGFIAPLPDDCVIKAVDGRVVWEMSRLLIRRPSVNHYWNRTY